MKEKQLILQFIKIFSAKYMIQAIVHRTKSSDMDV